MMMFKSLVVLCAVLAFSNAYPSKPAPAQAPLPNPDAAQVETVPISNFYPFGSSAGDSSLPPNDDDSSSQISIQGFPFFAHTATSLWVNNNGVVSFDRAVSSYTPQSFPLTGTDVSSLLSPYWGDVDTRGTGNVFYRESTDPNLLERASLDIRQIFPEFESPPAATPFTATYLYIVTWDHVGYFSAHTDLTNSFQSIMITDGTYSFVTFLYADGLIQWTTGDFSGGTGGFGGTPAQGGFDAGDGVRFFSIPGSQTDDIVNIDTTTNVGIPGQWTFRVDTEIITPVTCPCLSQPTHGRVTVNGLTVDSVATYECRRGSVLRSNTRVCTEDPNDPTQGVWVPEAPTCKLIACESLLPPNNGHVSVTGLVTGSVATYGCDEGYEISGMSDTRECVVDRRGIPGSTVGIWTPQAPVCTVISCPNLPAPANGHVTLTGLAVGSVASYDCDDGFALQHGPSTRQCREDGEWGGPYAPICTAIMCENQQLSLAASKGGRS